ncbi:tRNA (cytidine(34)-2'-O)-methyltransferase [Vreelandella aquamarina]|uniref:tRNA (cytidine(34)-2'-O)-methyltransferase n=1 Tax=Vreelandella aquamarina TaxID=77097 RepID=A0A1N6J378_9GAMM|nr:tRNA (cytidine(34)-2'-O)-methyltransferase [Halomonas meridiana]GED46105.1 tRNA (cytidine(34)-2'-O)-methyltransferase [Halomonas meridiana]SIN64725.1 tRNA (cytidine/uridine-2'-O-)-methyltransferase [Halomonas meridiana]SIN75166.1 tRNA (cytidine/uridine-2'-O-)-methyltransferase [Halomonas meridiana]SIO38838.1 tRNA (cytidine/uridine-2'-O-)-methyltransferase [Halomonas meridiana]|tara:strand:- start:157 stop:627 length:471 start_codon:yes stop_codon:yes gene_type:complete
MFEVALFEPRMAPNTGNIMRLVANNGCRLHLIEPLGFDLEEKKLRRAGLDYRDLANVTRHADFTAFYAAMQGRTIWAITTKGTRAHSDANFAPGDVLLFGSETAGLSPEVHAMLPAEHKLRIPMQPNNRSLNLSNAVAVVSYEAWRQQDYAGALAI